MESMTPLLTNALLLKFLNHPDKDVIELPEPDAKVDTQSGKKIEFASKEEKDKIIKEQKEISEKVKDAIVQVSAVKISATTNQPNVDTK